MDGTAFKAMVTKIGPANITGFFYDNVSRTMFLKRDFSLAEHYDDELQAIKITEQDIHGNPFIVWTPVENIQQIYSRDPRVMDKTCYNPRYMST